MSFTIKLQRNLSEKNRVSKETNDIMTVSGTLREETSIIDPVFRIVTNDISLLSNVNYADIETFGRKYFVTDIRAVRTGIIELRCHVDVLSSFADAIKSNTAIIKRQENEWNLYLNDGSLKVYQNPIVLTKAFPSGFNTQEFVLAVAGS